MPTGELEQQAFEDGMLYVILKEEIVSHTDRLREYHLSIIAYGSKNLPVSDITEIRERMENLGKTRNFVRCRELAEKYSSKELAEVEALKVSFDGIYEKLRRALEVEEHAR